MSSRTRHAFLALSLVALVVSLAPPQAIAASASALSVTSLETEHAHNPLGIDAARPRLGWALSSSERGQRQSAYEILVATSPSGLAPGEADVWDSGRVSSSATFDVRYAGPGLASRTRYWWRVRSWDAQGRASGFSAPAWFETAFLDADQWTGSWIGAPVATADKPSLQGASWIWYPEGDPGSSAPAATRVFRRSFSVPSVAELTSARLVMTGDDGFTAWIDGTQVASADPRPELESWRTPVVADVTSAVRGDANVLAVAATNGRVSPAGLLGRLELRYADGTTTQVDTDGAWRSATGPADGWQQAGFDDTAWPAAKVITAWGGSPWGQVAVATPTAPEPLLRKEFAVRDTPVRRARLYLSGVAYAEATLNGRQTTDAVLEPGFTRYDRTVQYVTRDVTDTLRPGTNALGVRLGRGFYGMTQANVWNWHTTAWTGEPRVLGQLEIEYADGTRQVIATDGSWRTAEGPVRYDSLYGGETYDARAEQSGWDAPGFDAGAWRPVAVVTAPAGGLIAESQEPIRVAETLRPTKVTSPRAGVYVFHLPRNVAGWARIRARGAGGTKVTLRYGETLDAAGNLVSANGLVTGRFQTDEYVLAGRAEPEQWESRYTYKGFQYVEVTGWPGTPTLEDLDGRVVHTDLASVGDWSSSQPLFETVRELTRRTVLNNAHGIPTDTPMYEKNGWAGDAQLMAETDMFEFDMRRFYEKWLGDIRDSQGADGLVPGIAPDNGWGLGWPGQAPPWDAAYVLIPWAMYERYGDRDILAAHYPDIRKYIEYEIGRAPGGLHSSSLNDYLAPGYGGNSPEDPTLAGTAYAYANVSAMAQIADVLDKDADAGRYRAAAARIRDAFNAAFLRADAYVTSSDPGYRQTNNLLPLAFDMVPAEKVEPVVARLVREIGVKGDHLDTGALGTKFLLTELTRRGYGDLAYRIATQRTYPSWGYWVDNGATSLWERWDLGARSRDHAFLGGAIGEWFYEDLAGIRPTAPGYERFDVAPQLVGDLTTASARLNTVRGVVASAWRKREGGALDLDVTVPVGATATVSVPAANRWAVIESGRPAADSPGVTFVKFAGGRAVFSVGSGTYAFRTGPQAARIGAAIDAASALGDAVTSADLSPAQRGYADARTRSIADGLHQSLEKTARGDIDAAGQLVQQSLAAEAHMSRWLGRQDGLPDADPHRLNETLTALHKALSEASAVLLGITVELTGADEALVAGSTARLTAVVRNSGAAPVRDVHVAASAPDGWTVRAGGDTGTGAIRPGDTFSVPLDVIAPLSASADSVPLHLTLGWTASGGTADTAYDEFLAVRPAVTVGTPRVDAWPDQPGTPVTVYVPVGNAADVALAGAAEASAPQGWTVTPETAELRVPAGGTANVQLRLTPTGAAIPASADLALSLTLRPEGRTDELHLPATVRVGNLARGRPVAAAHSLEVANWSKSLLVDGKRRSEDSAKGYTSNPPSTSRDAVEWVSIDLGAPTSLDRVMLHPRTQTPNDNGVPADGAAFPRTFQIQTSDDGSTWQTVRTVTDHVQQGTPPQAYALDGVIARYVRVYVTVLGDPAGDDAQRGLYRLQLAEFEAYGAQVKP
ncbi:family 78 glycoside hydrolase catalytic domain [Micromonospora coerulea]|uniref:family 78 glycoside hydrolase catalytic domain n=1 Tax=Micromonospora coerulea TaxID=47856 RepID=UPI0019080A5D|nr:family 78 glycoside hydrolase catalytic domain [Micromonospora veneta]